MLLHWLRKLRSFLRQPLATGKFPDFRYRLGFECLETRTLPSANVVMESLSRLRSTQIQYQYQVQNEPLTAPFTVNFYRSSNATFDPADILIGTDTALDGAVGDHTSAVVTLTAGFAPDLQRKFILAVATGVPSTQDMTALRTYILGVVTHGDAPTGKFPPWVTYVANQLKSLKYDAVIPFDWAKLAAIPAPGPAREAAKRMVASVRATIASVAPDGSWDLHLIGHSRGGVIISLAMQELISSKLPQLTGYKRSTYLDSHPANSSTDYLFNTLPQPTLHKALLGLTAYELAIRLQHLINDPPAFVPRGVDYAEAYFQKGKAAKVVYQPQEAILNLWGQNNIPSQGPAVHYVNLTVPGMSHTGVWRLYSRSIVQSLTTALPKQTTFVPSKPYDLRPLPCEEPLSSRNPTIPLRFWTVIPVFLGPFPASILQQSTFGWIVSI